MMGYGGYGNGGSYPSPSSSSNLSASAPPFTLDRSPKPGPTPLVDIVEPPYSGHMMNSSLTNWLPSRSPTSELNPVLSINSAYGNTGYQPVESSSTIVSASVEPFGYGGQLADNMAPKSHKDGSFATLDQVSYGWSSNSRGSTVLDGARSDYPAQRSSDSKYGAEWGDGLWNGFVEWKQGKQSHVSLSSKEADVVVPYMYENYMNPEAKIPTGSSRGKESSQCIDFLEIEKHGGPSNPETLVEKDFLGKASGFMNVDYSRSVLGSTQLHSPSAAFSITSVTHQIPYIASVEQHLKHGASDGISASDSRPSMPNSTTSEIMNHFHLQSISAKNPVLDPTQLRVHLERDQPISSAAFLTKVEETTSKEYTGIPSSGHEKFNMDYNVSETVNSVYEPAEGVDNYNHAVDSPCWKGVPVTHSSPFDSSEVVPDMNKLEANHNSKAQSKHTVQITSGEKVGSHTPNEVGEQNSEDATKIGHNSETKLGTLTQTIDVPGLVNTMQSLSEFLLFHCARGSFQLKEKEVEAVRSVMNNLSVCVSKNAEKIVSSQEPTLSGNEDPHDYLVDSPKVFTVDNCQMTNATGSIQAAVSGRNELKRSEFYTSVKVDEMGDQEIMDEDKAIHAHKKILMESFNKDETQPQTLLYKNLWLEAEAALCSVNYKARYSRMKIEMENSKSLKSKDALENAVTTTMMKKPLGSVVSPDSETIETLSPKDESFAAAKTQGLSVLSPSSHDDDVMARFRILKCRIENSNYSTPANVDKPSSSLASPHSDNVVKALPEEPEEKKASPKAETSTNKNINEFDASVIARFHVLKSRADTTEVPQPAGETKLPRFASQRTHWPVIHSVAEIGSSCVNPDTEISTEGRFPEFELRMFKEVGAQSQLHSGYKPESSVVQPGFERVTSSDWEHVRKEDLGWQNRW